MSDRRSPEAARYRKLYKTARWQRLRLAQLRTEPLCRMCSAKGHVTMATVCDHIEPHRGDAEKFWSGPFQSLCAGCHDSTKKIIEARGYSTEIGVDGWPVDRNHPAYR